jgi:hypothetical protein
MNINFLQRSDESSEITEFLVAIATNCRALKFCTNMSYAADHERVSGLLFRCAVSVP